MKPYTIDLTPTWEEVALLLAEGAAKGIPGAREELLRMARLADKQVALSKQSLKN